MTENSENIRKRNISIVEAFYEDNKSYTALAGDYGLSQEMIKKIIKLDKIRNGERNRQGVPVDPRKLQDRPPLSFDHFVMGVHLRRYMDANKHSQTKVGEMLTMSRVDVGKMLAGCYDITWTEMARLRELLELSQAELLTAPLKVTA